MRIGKFGLVLGIVALALAILGTAVVFDTPVQAQDKNNNSGLTVKTLGL